MYTNDETKPRDLSTIEKPAVAITVLVFSVSYGKLEILLIKLAIYPFKGFWSIPGDILDIDEALEKAAREVLCDKTGISDVYLEQLFTFGEPKRDPRGRVIAVTYFALLSYDSVDLSKAPSRLHAKWTSVDDLPQELAFDHREIIGYGVGRLKSKLEYSNIAQGLLPENFRLSELRKIYEVILNKKLDKRNFIKKMNSLSLIGPTKKIYRLGNHRPAKLYKFKTKELVTYN